MSTKKTTTTPKHCEFTFCEPLFGGSFNIIISGDHKDAERYVGQRGGDLRVGQCDGYAADFDSNHGHQILIWLRTATRNRLAEVAAHEGLHAMAYLYRDRGVTSKAMIHEPGAYMIGFIVRQILDGYDNWKKKASRKKHK